MRPLMFARVRAWRALLLASLALIAGLASASSASAEDTGPLFYGGTVTPTALDFNGGQVNITAKGLDDFTIFMFYAEITGPNAYVENVQLYPSFIPDDPNEPWTFAGVANIPPNNSGDPVQYYVNATVTDTNGQFASGPVGVVDVEAQPNFDREPVISAADVAPRSVPARAGDVTFTATATDDRNISSVVAVVDTPGQPTSTFDLTPSPDYPNYRAVFDVPDNTTASPIVYRAAIIATDDAGQSVARYVGEFTVDAAPTQPAGLLSLSPTWSLLGSVRPGQKKRATFTVRNNGKPGSATLTAYAAISGSTFSIVGAPGTEKTLAIGPGQSAQVVVEFAPTRRGAFNGRLTIRRQDGLQRSPTATLLGLAI